MNRVGIWLAAGGLFALAAPAAAADPPARPQPSAEAARLAARIDAILEAAWAEKKITPADPADDAEFLRRVYLDLAGRIPTVPEARRFLADTRPDKRRQLVAALLNRPTYARNFATVWRHLLLPEADTNQINRLFTPGFEAWLVRQFDRNAPYDEIVRDLLTLPFDQPTGQRGIDIRQLGQPTPMAFYSGKDFKPENLAAATSRVFLGFRLECAQCHNHPFAEWSRDQFWGLAAFFAGIRRQDGPAGAIIFPDKELTDRRELAIPGTEKVVQAAFPDGTEPEWKARTGPRQTLAAWVTAKNNPYFAKALANRAWAHFFGVGLVEPVDDMAGGDSTVHHSGVLDALAKAFVEHDHDLKFLFEAITATRAYQLGSRGQPDPPLFSRHQLRGLTGEQLYDSLAAATFQADGVPEDAFARVNGGTARAEFLVKFAAQPAKPTEYETSIIQALTLMNGRFVGEATNPARSELLAAVLDAPFLDDAARVETIYLAAVSRFPTGREKDRALEFLKKSAGTAGDRKSRDEAVADLFWALLNSAEFVFNH